MAENNNNNKKRITTQEENDMETEKEKVLVEGKKKGANEFKHEKDEDETLDEFAEPYEDDYFDEEVIVDPNDLSDDEEKQKVENQNTELNDLNTKKGKNNILKMMHDLKVDPKEEVTEISQVKVWRRDKDKEQLEPDDELEFDPDAYFMLHRMNVQWPCLSFDVLVDNDSFGRKKYPLTGYFVSGSQAENPKDNKIYVMKASQLSRMAHEEEDDEEEDDNDDPELSPELSFSTFAHPGCVNRIRSMCRGKTPSIAHIVASWSDEGEVYIWDIREHLKKVENPSLKVEKTAPLWKIKHTTEGFAMDWSPLTNGQLVTGDCSGTIRLSNPHNDSWTTQKAAFTGHKDSVEDLQWSPTEKTVFASCSVDQTVKIWDIRMPSPGCSFVAGDCDINVISWNSKTTHLLASGADDGSFKVWDLRSVKQATNSCNFIGHHQWHDSPITSIEWDPNDDSTLAVSSDDLLTIWDLSLEKEEDVPETEDDDIPPQLLFEHMGQKNIKELHWHPQLPGVLCSTAEDSINIFKPNIIEN